MKLPKKQFNVLDLPIWIVRTDLAKDDKPGNEMRLLMADWLLRRGGIDERTRGISPILAGNKPLDAPMSPAQKQNVSNLPRYTRAPKGEQVEKLAKMEQFLEKLSSTERMSSAESMEQVPLVTIVRSAGRGSAVHIPLEPEVKIRFS
ncbi:unnamed protein product [Strongylus vulgaris]|uniref:Uncharacterized protein n=1 Tax=Strongylus vulgaris TaxID=40348 RepID=A0A3P7IXS3_STRVU|nr:unnamed protein product [Strongylus vulgaris]